MQEVKSVRDADVSGKRVLMRLDFDVPLENGEVIDDTRLRAALPTLHFLHEHGAKEIIIIAHVGRPLGKIVEELRVAPVEKRLRELIDLPELTVRENLRFDPREEANDPTFAEELASLGDIYVNEAFANSHRAHASMVGIPKLLPSYAGLHVLEEIEHLSHALTPPQGSIALIAVTKADKLPLVEKLATLYSKVLVGGPDQKDYSPKAENIILPVDGIPDLASRLDIGPETRALFVEEVSKAPFVLWNGSLGWYEKGYKESTDAVAKQIIASGVKAVIGGGDTISALKHFQFDPEKVFLSTGGGAMLDFLTHGTLPAIEVLKK